MHWEGKQDPRCLQGPSTKPGAWPRAGSFSEISKILVLIPNLTQTEGTPFWG